MSREILKNLIEMIPDEDIDTICKIVIKFIPDDVPEPDEIQAIESGRRDRAENGTVPHESIDWG